MILRNKKTYSRYNSYKKKYKKKTYKKNIKKTYDESTSEDNNQIQCSGCNRIWDGYAHCSCWLIGMYQ